MDKYGNTALHFAAQQGDQPLSFLLVLKGANPNITNKSGITPTVIAKRLGHEKMSRVFIKHDGVLPSNEKGIAKTENILAESPKRRKQKDIISSKDQEDESMLDLDMKNLFPTRTVFVFNAAYLGLKEPLYSAITSKNIDSCDENGHTALMKAAFKNHIDIVTKLLSLNCNPFCKDRTCNTALEWACLAGNLKIVEILVGAMKTADICLPNVDGQVDNMTMTPLVAAAFGGYVDVVKYLVENGADINQCIGRMG